MFFKPFFFGAVFFLQTPVAFFSSNSQGARGQTVTSVRQGERGCEASALGQCGSTVVCQSLVGFRGPATTGQFQHCGLTVAFWSNYDPKKTRQGCAASLWNRKKHPLQIDPLPWTLNFLSRASVCAAKTLPHCGHRIYIYIYIYIYTHVYTICVLLLMYIYIYIL